VDDGHSGQRRRRGGVAAETKGAQCSVLESGAGVIEVQLEALRDGPETDPSVETVGVYTLFPGVQLHLVAPAVLCAVDEVHE